jgi:hypothetical protein
MAPGKRLRLAKRSDGRLGDPQLERTFREPYAHDKNIARLVDLGRRRASRRRDGRVRGPAGAWAGRVEEGIGAAVVFRPGHGSSSLVDLRRSSSTVDAAASESAPISRAGNYGCCTSNASPPPSSGWSTTDSSRRRKQEIRSSPRGGSAPDRMPRATSARTIAAWNEWLLLCD